ncbi:MAG: ferrous iron transport protein A [Robiginitomaculum sp.]|nr:ferrous iron transport protein A [Robiginitomaculum sp.]
MTETNHIETTLFNLDKHRPARICGFGSASEHEQIRLREIGFAEGDLVEILHVGLFGRSPLNVKLHGTAIAMRPNEAKMIRVIPADLHRDVGVETGSTNLEVCDIHGLPTSAEKPCCGACGSTSK